MPCGFFFLSSQKKTLDQLIKLIFNFNKLYSFLYHVCSKISCCLRKKEKNPWFIQRKVKSFLCYLNLFLLFKYRQNKWLLALLSCARLLAYKGLWIYSQLSNILLLDPHLKNNRENTLFLIPLHYIPPLK